MAIRHSLAQILLLSGILFLTIWLAEVACLAGGQVTVVAIGQIDADFAGLISISKRSIASQDKGNINLVVVLHTKIYPSINSGKGKPLSG